MLSKILIIFGLIVLSLSIIFGVLFISENKIRIGVNEPTYELDPNQKDILPILPTTRAGIPEYVELLREAKETKDISICQTLPDPQKRYNVFDYVENTPTKEQWIVYCKTLVNDNPSQCDTIPIEHTNPKLHYECKSVFGILGK
ncbi:hypothetical protein [Candidatus Nitrosopumilus salaria]|nr:hypothetical protein [Candidatus Nitrosopumilus salaria]